MPLLFVIIKSPEWKVSLRKKNSPVAAVVSPSTSNPLQKFYRACASGFPRHKLSDGNMNSMVCDPMP